MTGQFSGEQRNRTPKTLTLSQVRIPVPPTGHKQKKPPENREASYIPFCSLVHLSHYRSGNTTPLLVIQQITGYRET